MAINLKNESMYALQMYTQFIETISADLLGFYEQVSKDLEQGKVSTSYFEDLKDKINVEIIKNNQIIGNIESEITSRIRTKFPSIISDAKRNKMLSLYKEELEKNNINNKKNKAKVVDFKNPNKNGSS